MRGIAQLCWIALARRDIVSASRISRSEAPDASVRRISDVRYETLTIRQRRHLAVAPAAPCDVSPAEMAHRRCGVPPSASDLPVQRYGSARAVSRASRSKTILDGREVRVSAALMARQLVSCLMWWGWW